MWRCAKARSHSPALPLPCLQHGARDHRLHPMAMSCHSVQRRHAARPYARSRIRCGPSLEYRRRAPRAGSGCDQCWMRQRSRTTLERWRTSSPNLRHSARPLPDSPSPHPGPHERVVGCGDRRPSERLQRHLTAIEASAPATAGMRASPPVRYGQLPRPLHRSTAVAQDVGPAPRRASTIAFPATGTPLPPALVEGRPQRCV